VAESPAGFAQAVVWTKEPLQNARRPTFENSGETAMTELSDLWLPILLSAVFVHIASAIIHMGPFWHRNDYPGVPDEAKARSAIGALNVPPGEYMLPRCSSHAEMRTPEFLQKMTEGPVWLITVRPNGMPGMGPMMLQWFVYLLVLALFAGYIASHALAPGAHYLHVFRYVGTTVFMATGLGLIVNSIWYSRLWSTTFKLMFDGLIYSLLMAGTFGWLWPKSVGV
jgi:hypothetical protein